jgi:two-component system phosphate regulon sensor histidine kinase PhoR
VPALGLLGSIVVKCVEQEMLRQVEQELRGYAMVLQAAVRGRPAGEEQTRLSELRQQLGVRITLLAADGEVLVETDTDPQGLTNHADRPEIEAARANGVGRATRPSDTRGETMMYVARRVDGPDEAVRFVRVARPVTDVHAQAAQLHRLVWGTAAITAGVALVVAYVLAVRVSQPLAEIAAASQRIAEGDYGH